MSPEITLTASAFEVAWEHAGLGQLPIVLYVPPSGFEPPERAEVRRRAWDELERAGLAHRGQLEPALVGMFELLAAPRLAVDARLALGTVTAATTGQGAAAPAPHAGEVRGLAAANAAGAASGGRGGDSGVLARLAGGTLTLRPISGSGLGREIVSLMPAHPAGPGTSVSLPRELIDPAARAAGSSVYGFAEHLIAAGVPGERARMLARMIDGTRRRGQFGAAVRARDGRRRAAGRAVAFHDTGGGRYLMTDRTAADGTLWTTVTPATGRLLAEHVQGLLDTLAGAL